MKGVELPINTIIIVVIALIVLIALVALFFGTYNPTSGSTSLQAATSATCMRVNPTLCSGVSAADAAANAVKAARMPVYDFDANKNGVSNDHTTPCPDGQMTCGGEDNLEMLCSKYYGINGCCVGGVCCAPTSPFVQDCMKGVCGCP